MNKAIESAPTTPLDGTSAIESVTATEAKWHARLTRVQDEVAMLEARVQVAAERLDEMDGRIRYLETFALLREDDPT